MKKFLSLALFTAAVAGVAYASYAILNKKKTEHDDMDDLVFSEDFHDEIDLEDDSYFEVEIDESDLGDSGVGAEFQLDDELESEA